MTKAKRIPFCGVIEGSVVLRAGETSDEAITRAERALQSLLDRGAKSYHLHADGGGPVLGLEDPSK